ncbi:MAG: DUF3880 domain-containing protein [Sphingobium sp.]|nr:DUF3880 domain-containing protein [Sphingobium sp.]
MPLVCIASSFPEEQNRNLGIVDNLALGFSDIIGHDCVRRVSFETMADHVTQLRPNLVILVGSPLPHTSDYRAIARAAAHCGALFTFWTVEDPYEFDYNYRFVDYADVIFSNDKWAVEFYNHNNVVYLPTAAALDYKRPVESFSQRDLDVFFCGVAFGVRQRVISDALPVLQRYRSLVFGEGWPVIDEQIIRNVRISQSKLIDYYTSSKFVLNIGRDYYLANNFRATFVCHARTSYL